jgi:hypothetical protein
LSAPAERRCAAPRRLFWISAPTWASLTSASWKSFTEISFTKKFCSTHSESCESSFSIAPSSPEFDAFASNAGRRRSMRLSSWPFLLFRAAFSPVASQPTNPVSIEHNRIRLVDLSSRSDCSPLRNATVPGCAGKSASLSVDGTASCPASGQFATILVLAARSRRVISPAAKFESDVRETRACWSIRFRLFPTAPPESRRMPRRKFPPLDRP